MKSTQICRILAFACAAWLFWHRPAPAAAQQPAPTVAQQPAGVQPPVLAPRFPAEAAPAPIPFNDALNTPIDPNTYLLGPGDGLMISIYARSPADYPVDVSPDGFIQLPTIGAISVRGKTPMEVQRIVDEELHRVRKDFRLSVRTVRLRTIKVEIVGEVGKPGPLVCGSQTRAAEAVMRAGGPTSIASTRHIQIRRAGATLPEVNLEQMLKLGDETTNALLETGDQIFVPRAQAIVRVDGLVNNPGDYEVDAGESVKEVIKRAGGLRTDGAATAVYVERPGLNDRRILVPADLTRNPPPVILEDRDRIVVPSIVSVQGTIRVVGAVKGSGPNWSGDLIPKEGVEGINSGNYLLRQGDRVRDVIQEIGGLTSKADRPKAQIERPDGKGGKQVLPVDLQRLIVDRDESQNLELRDGDTLVIPTIVDQVYVLGQVLNPGGKQYEEGRTILDYVSQAGGVTNRARKSDTKLVRGNQKNPQLIPVRLDQILHGKLDANSIVVKPGDIIIVPEAQIKSWQDVAGILWGARALITGFFLF